MSVEVYLAVNLIADAAIIGWAGRALGVFNWRRTLIATALCAVYAVLAASRPMPWASPAIQAVLAVIVAAIIARQASPRLWLMVCATIAGAAMLCGGIAKALGLSGAAAMPLCVAAGLAPLALLYAVRPPARQSWQIWLRLKAGGSSTRFPALIDTGNCLREPRSGLPVLIAEASLLEGVLPEGGYRFLRFGGLGGEGRMACFKPTAVWIEDGVHRRRAPEVWVAASPDPLPGLHRALAPPEFALY